MSFAKTSDGVRLFYESAGSGTPIIFVHEFGGSHWSWEPQLNWFARRHRCITFAARGFPPSDIPQSVAAYSQARAADFPGGASARVRASSASAPTQTAWPQSARSAAHPDRRHDRGIDHISGLGRRTASSLGARASQIMRREVPGAAPARTRGIMHAQPRVAAARIRSYLRAGQLP